MNNTNLKISRRRAIIESASLAGSLATLFFSPEFRDTHSKKESQNQQKEFKSEPFEDSEQSQMNQRVYGIRSDLSTASKTKRTLSITAVSFAAQIAAQSFFDYLEIPNGQQGHPDIEKIVTNPSYLIFGLLARPLQEEFFFEHSQVSLLMFH